jgi:hypothetical protein
MKKISITACISFLAMAASAQEPVRENFEPFKNREFLFDVLHICATLAVVYMVSSFILHLFRQAMGYRIKNRILDKGTEENIVRQLLQPDKKENKNYILQWFFMLTAIGIGLLLVRLTGPFGLHSLSILAFSIAAGFGGYYYFSKQAEA